MAGISKAIVIGNLGRDPETRYTPNGAMNVRFSLAATRRYRDGSGQQQEQTTWFTVTAWGKLAEILDGLSQQGYIAKGKQVYVEGRLESREYQDQQGQTRFSLDLTASEFQLLGSRADSEGGGGGGGGGGRPQGGGGDRGGTQDDGGDDSGQQPSGFDDVPF